MYIQEFENGFRLIMNLDNPKLLNSFIKSAIKYQYYRANWYLWSIEERTENDEARTRAHNVFIDQCNIISRYMKKGGLNNAWRKELGDNRKLIGDFACFIVYRLALQNR